MFLELHGGDLNGYFLLRAAPAKLDALTATQEWNTDMVRAGMHLERSGAVRAVTGEAVNERMALWTLKHRFRHRGSINSGQDCVAQCYAMRWRAWIRRSPPDSQRDDRCGEVVVAVIGSGID